MPQHTPTPWILKGPNDVTGDASLWHDFGEKKGLMCFAALQVGTGADAAFLVHAANQYEALRSALEALLERDKANTCTHESTHRGGVLWEICDDCGAKWADDQGGRPEWEDPVEWGMAEAALGASLQQEGVHD